MWRPWQSTKGDSQALKHPDMDAQHFKMQACDHPGASNEP